MILTQLTRQASNTMYLRVFHILLLTLVLAGQAAAQSAGTARPALTEQERRLAAFADSMIHAFSAADRFRADSHFVRGLVRALQTPHSFHYPFDSLQTVSRLYAPDSSFRIFTWQLQKDAYVMLQKGAIQTKTPDGSLRLFPLFDYSMYTNRPEDSVRTPQNWIGAIYYRILRTEDRGKPVYTLLGFDGFSVGSNKKWMDVLTFNARGEPLFGGPYFFFDEDTGVVRKPAHRLALQYKKEAAIALNFDPELDMIIYDHLVSESGEPERKETYIPDGTYEGFRWKNGRWMHVEKVFDYAMRDGEFPVEELIRGRDGQINERILERSSERNLERARQRRP